MSPTTIGAPEFFKRAASVAEHYGFRPLSEIPKQPTSVLKRPAAKQEVAAFSPARPHEKSFLSFTRVATRQSIDLRRTPTFVYRNVSVTRPSNGIKQHAFELHALGIQSVIAEAMLISAAMAVATEMNIERPVVRINSIGGADSRARFLRDIVTYLKRHDELLPAQLRFTLGCDALGSLVRLVDKKHPIIEKMPSSMEYLNEEERRHLAELLEYLEINNIPYELSAHVVGSSDHWNHTLFEIASEDGTIHARGGRYDTLAAREAGDGAFATGISFTWGTPDILKERKEPKGAARAGRIPPQVYFAHLGPEAKRRSIGILEILRQARVPVYQSLAHEHMIDQMKEAQQLATPYLLIMGHKEAMEGTVLVREVRSNAQKAVPVPDLATYLRRRRLSVA
jgi:histidyl-tRNA synthetase